MNNYILISRSYAEVTPESAEIGDFSKTGLISTEEKITFRELVNLMREFNQPSCAPNDGSIYTWYSTGFYTSDYGTGTEREESIHFDMNNTPNAAKYWKLAAKAAGLTR